VGAQRRFKNSLKWLSGGGLATYLVIRGVTFAEGWIQHDWKVNAESQAELVEAIKDLTGKMGELVKDLRSHTESEAAFRAAMLERVMPRASRPLPPKPAASSVMPVPSPSVAKPVSP
jgi:hypothetical protein